MKASVICIEGYWKDNNEKFEHRCVVMPKNASDSMRDEILKEISDNDVFYVFNEGETIVGAHGYFVVEFYNPIYEIELGEVQ